MLCAHWAVRVALGSLDASQRLGADFRGAGGGLNGTLVDSQHHARGISDAGWAIRGWEAACWLVTLL